MKRVLLVATTTGYQTRAFGEAAERLGVDLVLATDRCDVLEDPWQDRAIPIRFSDESASAEAILEVARTSPLDGVLAVGDRPTVIASLVQEGLGLPGHPAAAAAAARNKLLTREHLRALAPAESLVSADFDRDGSAGAGGLGLVSLCLEAARALGKPRGHARRGRDRARRRFPPAAGAAGCARPAGRAQRHARPRARRGFRRRPRVRARRADEPRHAAPARDLRQARSARRPILRRDHLCDPDDGVSRRAARDDRRCGSGGARSRPAPRTASRRVSRERDRRLRPRSCRAADRRFVRPRAAICAKRGRGYQGSAQEKYPRPRSGPPCLSRNCCSGMHSANPRKAGRARLRPPA